MIKDVRDDTLEYEEFYLNYLELIERVDTIFAKIMLNHFIVADCTTSIVDKLYHNYKYFLPFVVGAKAHGREKAKQAVDCAILAAAIAEYMDQSIYNKQKIIESSLLHDVGMLYIPKDILDKPESLSKAEYWHILTHPVQSFKFIGKELRCFEGVSGIVLQHHEFWNGNGYPKRLAGTDIALEARIIAVADVFSALISKRPYRPPLGGHRAISNLIANTETQFDPAVLKIFIQVMGIYPPGSLVELNNGATARVVEYGEDTPMLKPRVRLLTSSAEDSIKKKEIVDLLYEKGLYIRKALDGQDMILDMVAGK